MEKSSGLGYVVGEKRHGRTDVRAKSPSLQVLARCARQQCEPIQSEKGSVDGSNPEVESSFVR